MTAAVRGTIFEINLDQDYIHSVNHAVNLTDKDGKSVDLLPGEVVKITNIFDRLTQAVLDSAWNALNQVADTEFIAARTKEIQAQITSLSGTDSIWDRFIRWILSYVPSFDRIKVAKMLDMGTENFDAITSHVSTVSLVRWYQDIANTDFSADLRQTLREKILSTATPDEKKTLEPTLVYGAIWDRFSATSSGLSTSLDTFISKMGATATPEIRKLYDGLNKQFKVEDTIQQGIDTLKNSIQDIVKPN